MTVYEELKNLYEARSELYTAACYGDDQPSTLRRVEDRIAELEQEAADVS